MASNGHENGNGNGSANNGASGSWMIYGANGYSGELAARLAVSRGLSPILAGRNREAVERLGQELGLPVRVFSLDSEADTRTHLRDVAAVLHCAGPFSRTSAPMLEACIETGTHYLDITGELDVFEAIHNQNERIATASIVALPGTGFDVVPSDCLAAKLKRAVPGADSLSIGFRSSHGKGGPGTMKTMFEGMAKGARVRRDGKIVLKTEQMVKSFPFIDDKEQPAVALSWGDVATAYRSTGIPNIECFIGVPKQQIKGMQPSPGVRRVLSLPLVQKYGQKAIGRLVKGPTEDERRGGHMYLVGEVSAPDGSRKRMRLTLPDGSEFTAAAALACVERVLAGDVPAGAQTPATAFGADFVDSLEGVKVEELR